MRRMISIAMSILMIVSLFHPVIAEEIVDNTPPKYAKAIEKMTQEDFELLTLCDLEIHSVPLWDRNGSVIRCDLYGGDPQFGIEGIMPEIRQRYIAQLPAYEVDSNGKQLPDCEQKRCYMQSCINEMVSNAYESRERAGYLSNHGEWKSQSWIKAQIDASYPSGKSYQELESDASMIDWLYTGYKKLDGMPEAQRSFLRANKPAITWSAQKWSYFNNQVETLAAFQYATKFWYSSDTEPSVEMFAGVDSVLSNTLSHLRAIGIGPTIVALLGFSLGVAAVLVWVHWGYAVAEAKQWAWAARTIGGSNWIIEMGSGLTHNAAQNAAITAAWTHTVCAWFWGLVVAAVVVGICAIIWGAYNVWQATQEAKAQAERIIAETHNNPNIMKAPQCIADW